MVPEKTLLIIKEKPRIYCVSALVLGLFSKCWEFGGTAGSIYVGGAFLDLWFRGVCPASELGVRSGRWCRKPGAALEAGYAAPGAGSGPGGPTRGIDRR